jgi:ABC-type transport system substrate-binding protein
MAPEIRCFLLPQWPSDCLWLARGFGAGGDRCALRHFDGGHSADHRPADRGAGAYQFSAYTIYDPLVAWEMDVSDRPGKLVPGLATEWKVDESDKRWRLLAQGRQVS